MRSLFVVSLPRSLSTLVYQLARRSLNLKEPAWTSDGEILNLERYALRRESNRQDGHRFTHPRYQADRFERLIEFLSQVTQPEGFGYKDVVQPFAVAQWLASGGLGVLKIERSIADVAHAMLQRRWLYPAAAAGVTEQPSERDVVVGLGRARSTLEELPGVTVRFDELIFDESVLGEALSALGDGHRVDSPRYLDDVFVHVRSEVLARRQTERYRQISELCEELGVA